MGTSYLITIKKLSECEFCSHTRNKKNIHDPIRVSLKQIQRSDGMDELVTREWKSYPKLLWLWDLNRFWCMVFNATFNNISVISWRSVLLVEETGVTGENHRPVASNWQTLSHNVESSTPRHERGSNSTLVVIGTDCTWKGSVVYLFLVFSLMVGCSQTDILRQSEIWGSPFPVCLIYALWWKSAKVADTHFVLE